METEPPDGYGAAVWLAVLADLLTAPGSPGDGDGDGGGGGDGAAVQGRELRSDP
ncbi:hypothetical protein [Streptomyces sp. NPDC090022]|uniref:hypothetical protein n=1 Tax=Streptomyces sp. NPDC090022 TaxID=3365920 RepID=UPI0037F8426E